MSHADAQTRDWRDAPHVHAGTDCAGGPDCPARAQAPAGLSAPSSAGLDRDTLGRVVRETWVEWAREQPEPKPSWLVSYDDLPEPDREVDRRIGERLYRLGHDGPGAEPSPADARHLLDALDRVRALVESAEAERFRNEACRHTVEQPYADNRYVRLLDAVREAIR